MELAPGVIVGDHYRLDSLLGVGGMGAVWLCTDLSLGRVVALKVLHTDLRSDPQLNERFQREARLLASVEHPAIVPIYAWIVLEDGGRACPGIVMPFVKGESLADALRRRRTIAPADAFPIVRQLLDALGAAHAAGIVHRDLKPQNVMLEERAGGTQVRLLDFGVAKSLAPSGGGAAATQVGMIIGTPEYMSPEQISDPTSVDARADLWAVSVTLFEMLTGNLPFPGQTPVETIARVLTGVPMPPSSFNPALTPALDAFFQRALSRQIGDRPRTAGEMAQQIDALGPARSQSGPSGGPGDAPNAFSWPPQGTSAPPPPGQGQYPPTSAMSPFAPSPFAPPSSPAQPPFAQPPFAQPPFAQPPGTPPSGFGPQQNQLGAAATFAQFSAANAPPSPFYRPGNVAPYVPPPAGLPPFPPGNSLAEEREKKIVMYVIIAIAGMCVVSILGAALFSAC